MMDFSSASEIDGNKQEENLEAFVKNLLGAVRSEQVPHLTAIVCHSLDAASEKDWDAQTTTVFVKDIVSIFVGAQSDFAHELAT